jgi:hypothetical protein
VKLRTSTGTLDIPAGPLLRLPISAPRAAGCPRKTAEEVGLAVLERFTAHNAQRVAEGRALSDEIRSLLASHVGPGAATAERIQLRITRNPAPSLRTVQRHLRAIKSGTNQCR